MKKTYETFRVDIVLFENEDIITKSTQADPFGMNSNPVWVGGNYDEE